MKKSLNLKIQQQQHKCISKWKYKGIVLENVSPREKTNPIRWPSQSVQMEEMVYRVESSQKRESRRME